MSAHRVSRGPEEVVSAASTSFDVVILGGGSGGYACALRASQLGLSVALVEKDKLGGTCLHWGCIPTKALLHAAEVADAVRESAKFGVEATLDKIDLIRVNTYKDGVVDRLYKGLQGLIKSRGVTVIGGVGRLVGPSTVEVEGTRYGAKNVVLASGSVTKSLPGLEIDGTRVLTSREALRLERMPARAVVLGGGVIGVEFASAWRSFGVEVTILGRCPGWSQRRIRRRRRSWSARSASAALPSRPTLASPGSSSRRPAYG